MSDITTIKAKYATIYRHHDINIQMEDDGVWVTMGVLSGECLIVDQADWPAFVEMINAIDKARKEKETHVDT